MKQMTNFSFQNNMKSTGQNFGMDVTFKDYISTFANEEEFSQKPYAKFYSKAIDKHS